MRRTTAPFRLALFLSENSVEETTKGPPVCKNEPRDPRGHRRDRSYDQSVTIRFQSERERFPHAAKLSGGEEQISEQFVAPIAVFRTGDTVIDALIIYLECPSWTGSLLMIPHTRRCKGSDKYRERDMEYCTPAILKLGEHA